MTKSVQFLRVEDGNGNIKPDANKVSAEWLNFPGSGGSFNANTSEIDDTILGEEYQSNDRGLLDWTISTDAVFKGYPGYTCRISATKIAGKLNPVKLGQVQGNKWQIRERSKRLLLRPDQFDSPMWEDAGVSIRGPYNANHANSAQLLPRVVKYMNDTNDKGDVNVTGSAINTIDDITFTKEANTSIPLLQADTGSGTGIVAGNAGYITDASGAITNIVIGVSAGIGTGFAVGDMVTFTGTDKGFKGRVSKIAGTKITAIDVLNGGSGYVIPQVNIESTSGSGALAAVSGESSNVWTVLVDHLNKGTGYTGTDKATMYQVLETQPEVDEINYLDGTITFDGAFDVGTTTLERRIWGGYYLQLQPLVRATDYTLNMQVNMKDETNFTEASPVVLGQAQDATSNPKLIVYNRDGYRVNKLTLKAAAAAGGNTHGGTARVLDDTLVVTPLSGEASAEEVRNVINSEFASFGGLPGRFYAVAQEGAGNVAIGTVTNVEFVSRGYPAPEADQPDARGDGAGGYMLYTPGLRTFNLSISGVEIPNRRLPDQLDYHKVLRDRREIMVEINPDGLQVTRTGDGVGYPATSGVGFLGWFRQGSTGNDGDVGQTQTSSLEFTLAVPQQDDVSKTADPVAIVGNTERLRGATKECFESWLNGEFRNEVRFIPDSGTLNGAIQGKCALSNFTLSGGISSMNRFQVELMGNGRYVEVKDTFQSDGSPVTEIKNSL